MLLETDLPTEQLLNAGVVGVVCLTILIALGMWLRARNKPDGEQGPGNPLTILLPLLLIPMLLCGCGSYSQSRMDHLDKTKDDEVYLVERALQGKLTATELRSKLQNQDTAMLAEQAHKGEGLDALRKDLEHESDAMVARLFNGDNGREDPPGD